MSIYAWLTELKELYAPIDPDADTVPIPGCTRPATDDADERFLGAFEAALVKANYRKLEFKVLENAIAAPNELGLNYVPDLKLFEHLRVYVRGVGRIDRTIRTLKTRFLKRTLTHDAYRRVVIVLKFKPADKLGEYVRHDVVYLRLFRDVPHAEMDMHLPEQGTKIRMPWIDRLQVASPLMVGLPTLAAKAIFTSMLVSPWAVPLLLTGPIGAGVKSFLGFQRTKQKYLAKMIRHLYYLTLANNSSVINRLVDSAEEEEIKEALLAYFFLWVGRDDPEPWDARRLDARIEAFLREKRCGDVDFEIADALAKLNRLGLVRPTPRLISRPSPSTRPSKSSTASGTTISGSTLTPRRKAAYTSQFSDKNSTDSRKGCGRRRDEYERTSMDGAGKVRSCPVERSLQVGAGPDYSPGQSGRIRAFRVPLALPVPELRALAKPVAPRKGRLPTFE